MSISQLREYLRRLGLVRVSRGCILENCIFSVPEKLRKLREDAYNPHFVSIGPFHRNIGNLAPMQQHKRGYLNSLFPLLKVDETFENYQGQIPMSDSEIHTHVQNMIYEYYYSGLGSEIYKYDYLEMPFLDGCFILELFLSVGPTCWASVLRLWFSLLFSLFLYLSLYLCSVHLSIELSRTQQAGVTNTYSKKKNCSTSRTFGEVEKA
ncbi:hypothetical protein ACLB2K_056907 [Fragaria x ananassa]